MSEIIQFNRFSEFHDGKNIFFCKTDFLQKDFNYISKLNKDAILISGNSDYAVSDDLVKLAPKNISKWFCQNNISSDPKIISLPMGIENHKESKRFGHGARWDFAAEKNKILSSLFTKKIRGETTNLIYANFNISTNPEWRNRIKNICLKLNYVTLNEPNLSYPEFITNVISHEAVVCPIGHAPTNGECDNHRIYEVLYANRIPIVFSRGHQTMYDRIYKFLPVVLLKSEDELFNKTHLMEQIEKAKEKSINKIKFSFWKKEILKG